MVAEAEPVIEGVTVEAGEASKRRGLPERVAEAEERLRRLRVNVPGRLLMEVVWGVEV
jgi:hypothetical protein